MSITGTMSAAVSVVQAPASSPGQSSAQDTIRDSATFTIANGTGANQADLVYREDHTIAGGADLDLDLTGGGLTDRFGAALAFATVKGIILTVQTTGGTIVLGPTAANGLDALFGATAAIPVAAGGALCWFTPGTGVTVTGGSADSLTLTNNGGSNCTCQITIIGTSA